MRPADHDLRSLTNEQWRELDECANRLENALRGGATSVDLGRFLPPAGAAHRLAVLHELIKTELEARYLLGQHCLLEEYVLRYPEVGDPGNLPVSLLLEEFHLRQRFGYLPVVTEYRDRFPLQFEEFRRQVQGNLRMDNKPIGLQQLVGYQKIKTLGRGMFGEVWKALAPGGVEVALKFILCKIDRELQALEEIKRLRHPHLLQTHSFGMLQGNLTIVMELADMSLSDRFRQCVERGQKAIPKEWLATYFKQAAAALDYLRSQRVSHCDIKPENLLIQQGLAKVADFGLARAQNRRLDQVWTMAGSPRYMPPEVWKLQVSNSSDQYSLAATYAHMRLGRPLFEGSEAEVREQHLSSDPKLDPLPPQEQAVLKVALAKDPDHRFPSCEAFAKALDETVQTPTATPARAAPQSRSVGLILTVASLAFVLIALFVMNRGQTQERPDWHPEGWEPEGPKELVEDRDGRRFYRRLAKHISGQKVVMVVVPRSAPDDPPTFYIMENKVWNELYGVLYPKANALLKKYTSRPECLNLGSTDAYWMYGAVANSFQPSPGRPHFGVDEPNGYLPVVRVTATEAHCFAELLDGRHGRLPSLQQWRKAFGVGIDKRKQGPYEGAADDLEGFALRLEEDGPWPVDRGERDVTIYGARQMATNGWEWTRTVREGSASIPFDRLEDANNTPAVFLTGKSYQKEVALLFADLVAPTALDCAERRVDVTFRVVLEE